MKERQEQLHILNQAARRVSKKFNEKLSPKGLYSAQWAIILRLHYHGPSTQKEICEYLSVESPTMTRTLTRMESMGWIVRKVGNDRRENQIHLTSLAKKMIPQWEKEVQEFEQKALQHLSDAELIVTYRALKQILKNLDD
jgi:MarR family transcriptional regulator for hemolysin